MLSLLLAAAAAAAPAAANPSSPRLLNGQDLVTADDYPLVSLNKDEEGVVTVRISVDQNGVAASCAVAQSSGHAALDEQTCAIYRARAQFAPARDQTGRGIPSTYTHKVTWKLEGDSAPRSPRQPWMVRTTVSFAADGKPVGCKSVSTGLPTVPSDCDAMTSAYKPVTPADARAKAAVETTEEVNFYPVAPASAPDNPMPSKTKLVGRQVSEIEIDRDGSVTRCKAVSYAGGASPDTDACSMIGRERFEAAPSAEKPLVGTFVVTVYTRPHQTR